MLDIYTHRNLSLLIYCSMKQAEQNQIVQDFIHGLVSNVIIIGYELFRKVGKIHGSIIVYLSYDLVCNIDSLFSSLFPLLPLLST